MRRKEKEKMVQRGTIRTVLDNSGVREVRCIQVSKNRKGTVGDHMVGVVTKVRSGTKWERGMIVKGVIVWTAKSWGRGDGMRIKASFNAMVVLNKKGEPVANRVPSTRQHEIRRVSYGKVSSMSVSSV